MTIADYFKSKSLVKMIYLIQKRMLHIPKKKIFRFQRRRILYIIYISVVFQDDINRWFVPVWHVIALVAC